MSIVQRRLSKTFRRFYASETSSSIEHRSFAVVTIGICRFPPDLGWRHVFGAGLLGGIGFTMSTFITNLAFAGNAKLVNDSKAAILLASLTAGAIGFLWLRFFGRPTEPDTDMNTMDLQADDCFLPTPAPPPRAAPRT